MTVEKRRARRIILDAPTVVRPITQPEMKLHPNLERVYERVACNTEQVGESVPAVIRDISVGGAFIAGVALPLLTRVAFSFDLEGHGTIEAIAWTLWRRQEDCEIPLADEGSVTLPMGFGVLFEAIPLEARIAIHNIVLERSK